MSIIDRLLKIAEAEVNAALDRVEDPEALLAQAILDGEQELADARLMLQQVIGDRLRIEDEIKAEQRAEERWETKAAQAIDNGHEELARQALEVSRDHRKRAEQIENDIQTLRENSAQLQTLVGRMEQDLEHLRERKDIILTRLRTMEVQAMAAGESAPYEEGPIDLFERMKTKAGGGEQIDNMTQSERVKALERQFEQLEGEASETRVQEKLAAMKARLNLE